MSTLKANKYQHVDRTSPSIEINSDGSVSISSTVTYEDVTSVDAVGMITARSGLRATAGGLVVTAGIVTFNNGLDITGNIVNGLNVSAGIVTFNNGLNVTGNITNGLNVSAGIVTFAGAIDANSTTNFADDVVFTGAAANVTWDKSVDDLIFNDNAKATFGTSSDMTLWHDGSHSHIQHENVGNLYVLCKSGQINFETASETMCQMIPDGAVKLYHNNTSRIETTSAGILVSGKMKSIEAGETTLTVGSSDAGGAYLLLDGDSNGDGSGGDYAAIGQDTSGNLIIQSRNPAGTGDITLKVAGTETGAVFTANGAASLYHNNSVRLETTSGGNKSIKSGQNDFVLGSSDAGGAYLILDGDSNGDASGSDYSYIAHDTGGDLIIAGDNPSGDADLIFKAGDNAEKMRIGNDGTVSITTGAISAIAKLQLYGSGGASDALADNLRFHNWGDANGDYWQIGSNLGLDANGNNSKPSNTFKGAAIMIDGRGGRIFFKCSPSSSSTVNEGLIMNESGYVTRPKLPCFSAQGTPSFSNFTGYNNSAHSFGAVNHNNGSHYDNTTGRFTAPVDGYYYFSCGLWVSNADNQAGSYVMSLIRQNADAGGATSVAGASHAYEDNQLTCSGGLNMSAGQTMRVDYNGSINSSTPRNYFTGHLVG